MTRPPDRFDDASTRTTKWNDILDAIETNEGRELGPGELRRLYSYFEPLLPERQRDYPSGQPRDAIWSEHLDDFARLEDFINDTFQGDYDLADFIDYEKDWRENYEEVS